MRVHVASLTGTHPLDLARELHKVGALGMYYTGLPFSRVPGLPRTHVATHPVLLMPHFLLRRGGLGHLERHFDWRTTEAFDRWLDRALDDCDVLHVPSGRGLHAMRGAKKKY